MNLMDYINCRNDIILAIILENCFERCYYGVYLRMLKCIIYYKYIYIYHFLQINTLIQNNYKYKSLKLKIKGNSIKYKKYIYLDHFRILAQISVFFVAILRSLVLSVSRSKSTHLLNF